ncbi:MAG: HEAT repeat domain-containing protein [Anaerolineae bacterium]|nr:HEAT repeat domain-containing protein [Anaerolineae bacterium]
MTLATFTPEQLVNLLWDKTRRQAVITALVGGLTATELRRVVLSPAARAALIQGLQHPHSKVRWWCVQLLDHLADESAVPALLAVARTDPTPRNRRHALHALACPKCKPDGCRLKVDLREDLREISRTDPDASVRQTALDELAELAAL